MAKCVLLFYTILTVQKKACFNDQVRAKWTTLFHAVQCQRVPYKINNRTKKLLVIIRNEYCFILLLHSAFQGIFF